MAIITIAFDNAKIAQQPQKWNLPQVLTLSGVLGAVNVVATFLLYYLGQNYGQAFGATNQLNPSATTPLQTLIFFNIALLGMMTLYSVWARGPFWSIPPAKPLALATGTSVAISTLLAIFGFFGLIQPIGLGWAIFNWVYCFVWLLIIDRTKLTVYGLFSNRRVIGLGRRYQHSWARLRTRI